jgi:hypothetical protein
MQDDDTRLSTADDEKHHLEHRSFSQQVIALHDDRLATWEDLPSLMAG